MMCGDIIFVGGLSSPCIREMPMKQKLKSEDSMISRKELRERLDKLEELRRNYKSSNTFRFTIFDIRKVMRRGRD